MPKQTKSETEKQVRTSKERFVLEAIKLLRKSPHKGIHTVFSGFNEGFRQYFKGADPVKAVNKLVEKGIIVKRPALRGVIIYDAKDVDPEIFRDSKTKVKKFLDKIEKTMSEKASPKNRRPQ